MPSKLTEQVLVMDEVIAIPKKSAPATVLPTGVNSQYEAAKRIRVAARHLAAPATNSLMAYMRMLETELRKDRGKRADRILYFENSAKYLGSYLERVAVSTAEIRALAQLLPTVPNIPQTNSENVIAAFIAILKTNGWEVTRKSG